MRWLLTLLLIIVFFLAGVVYGMSSNQMAGEQLPVIEVEETAEREIEMEPPREPEQLVFYPSAYEQAEQKERVHITEKAANLLEACVKGFYELIVTVLSAFSERFF